MPPSQGRPVPMSQSCGLCSWRRQAGPRFSLSLLCLRWQHCYRTPTVGKHGTDLCQESPYVRTGFAVGQQCPKSLLPKSAGYRKELYQSLKYLGIL